VGGIAVYEMGTPDVGLAAAGWAVHARDPLLSWNDGPAFTINFDPVGGKAGSKRASRSLNMLTKSAEGPHPQ